MRTSCFFSFLTPEYFSLLIERKCFVFGKYLVTSSVIEFEASVKFPSRPKLLLRVCKTSKMHN